MRALGASWSSGAYPFARDSPAFLGRRSGVRPLHLSWNTWNEAILGDVYGWKPGLFGGEFWVFNGEGPFGLLVNGTIAAWLLWRWSHRRNAALAS